VESNAQAWNRYSYVGNDPLAFTDPSGFSWLSSFFRSVANFFTNNPIVRAITQLVVTAALTALIAIPIVGPIIAAAAGAAIITGLSGGNLGQMIRAGVIAGITAAAFWGAGELTGNFPGTLTAAGGHGPLEIGSQAHLFNIASHAAVGCLSSAASGGSCKSGALSGAAGAAATPLVYTAFPNPKDNVGDFVGGTAASGVVGGLASVAGGGKFENGAVTAAFGYMYNACAGECWTRALKVAARMTFEWATGNGPVDRYFGSGSDQANDLMDSPGVERARQFFYNKNAGGGSLQGVDNYRSSFGLSGLASAGLSPTAQFAGSFRVDISPISSEDATYLMFTVTNNSSMQSFLYGIGPAYDRGILGPGGNMRQTYQWIERMR
jgi:hypothetical protein